MKSDWLRGSAESFLDTKGSAQRKRLRNTDLDYRCLKSYLIEEALSDRYDASEGRVKREDDVVQLNRVHSGRMSFEIFILKR